MFRWHHEVSYEVDIPIVPLWDFSVNPSNWPKWIDQFDSCKLDSENPNVVKAKIKNHNAHISLVITHVEPLKKFQYLIKNFFMVQESQTIVQEISPTRTRIIFHNSVRSFLTPFFKCYYRKHVEKQGKRFVEVLSAIDF